MRSGLVQIQRRTIQNDSYEVWEVRTRSTVAQVACWLNGFSPFSGLEIGCAPPWGVMAPKSSDIEGSQGLWRRAWGEEGSSRDGSIELA